MLVDSTGEQFVNRCWDGLFVHVMTEGAQYHHTRALDATCHSCRITII